ncbi:lipoprotein insertase outer membrane protein LolB [Marinobacter sp. V034]|uniref:lipoprotein insertase outer membrane protein LolB n=1 Tax=Marinobacter sp. V034 TaxID=3459610 RepID=UPI004043A003
MQPIRLLSALTLSLLLAACASVPDTPLPDSLTNQPPADWTKRQAMLEDLNHWVLQGKLAVRQPDDSGSAVINRWQQDNDQYSLMLSSAFLGMGRTELEGMPGFITLTLSDGKVYRSNDPQELIKAATGWQFPIHSLSWWIKGVPAPDGDYELLFDQQGVLAAIRQQGWDIRIDRRNAFIDGYPPLPSRITAFKEDRRIRLVVTDWQTTQTAP